MKRIILFALCSLLAGAAVVQAAMTPLVKLTFDDAGANTTTNLGSLNGTQNLPSSNIGKAAGYGSPNFGFPAGNQWGQGNSTTAVFSTYVIPQMSSVTMAYWFFPQISSGWRGVFSSDDGVAGSRLGAYWDASLNLQLVGAGGNYTVVSGAFSLATWTHVALTYTNIGVASKPVVYVNGLLVTNTGNWTGDVLSGSTGLAVAGIPGASALYGAVDNIFVFNSVLSQSQIQSLMTTNELPIPEPAALGLLALGLFGLVSRRARR